MQRNLEEYRGFLCVDCGTCTSHGEYYSVLDSVWILSGLSLEEGGGMLCIKDLERRIGRKLHRDDFKDRPLNINNLKGWKITTLLRNRMIRHESDT